MRHRPCCLRRGAPSSKFLPSHRPLRSVDKLPERNRIRLIEFSSLGFCGSVKAAQDQGRLVMLIRTTLVVAFLVIPPVAAESQLFCDRPKKPYCVDMLGISRDEFTFQSCRVDVETFQRRVKEYVDCLDHEQQDLIDELRRTISRFNACAASSVC